MSKYVRKLMPYLSCDILAIEEWLCTMAKKGLFYVESGPIFAKFERGEPKERHYKLEYENIVGCHMPADKQAMYEEFGWTVLDDIKSDLVVRCTDGDVSEDEEEITIEKVSALEQIQRKHFRLGIFYIVLWLLSRDPLPLLKLAFGSQKFIVSDIIMVGTGKYIFLTVIGLFLLFEGIYRIVHSARLKKYIESLKENVEPRKYRNNKLICTVMTKLSVPLVILWLASFFIANPFAFQNEYHGVYEIGEYDFPLLDEINSDEWQRLIDYTDGGSYEPPMWMYKHKDLLSKDIYIIEQRCIDTDNGDYFEYTVYYYDMNKEQYAQKLMEENTEEILNTYDKLDIHDNSVNEHKIDGCNVKYFKDDTSNQQCLLIRYGSEYEEVSYYGDSDLSEYVDLYISYLKK